MSNHFLKRNAANEPVCSCGYRPEILDDPAPVGQQWKAKTAVLNHATARLLSPALDSEHSEPRHRRSPDVPFRVADQAKFPRAGVRQTEDGRWLLTCWDADRIVHVIDEPVFDDRLTAFDYGYLTIGACRQAGTNLNGWATA